jgi:gas vesicle protein
MQGGNMGKSSSFVVGMMAGAAVGALFTYIFAPAKETTFDAHYLSRWDWAVAEGDKAAAARELELRQEFEMAKQQKRNSVLPSD